MHNSKPDHAACVILGPGNRAIRDLCPLVMDLERSEPYWKLPGGKVEQNETSKEAAIRELQEETGLVVQDLILIDGTIYKSRQVIVYAGLVDSFNGLKKRGSDGELVRLFHIDRILMLENFLPLHKTLLRDWLNTFFKKQ